MKLILIPILAIVILQDLTQVVQASCSVKLDESNVNDLIKTVLQKKNTDETSVGPCQKEMVAFSVYMTRTQSLSIGTVLQFQKEWLNIGKGFNTNTGIFTAPSEGVYEFSGTLLTTKGRNLFVRLYHNNLQTSAMYFQAVAGQYNANTMNIILQLKKGDTISIKSGFNNQSVYGDTSNNFSLFSGHRI